MTRLKPFALVGAIGLVSALLALAMPAFASTVGDYNRLLKSVSQGLVQAQRQEKARPGSGRPILDGLSRAVPASMTIEDTDGRTINVDLRWLNRGLSEARAARGERKSRELRDLLARTRAYEASTHGISVSSGASLDRARDKLREILARREFKPSALDAVVSRIFRWIFRVLSNLHVARDVQDTVGWVFLALLAVLCVIAITVLVLRLIARYSNGQEASERELARPRTVRETRQSFESLLESAEREAESGRYREAFRCVYVASLYLLDRAQLIAYNKSATNWEHLRVLKSRAQPDATDAFSEMTRLFDRLIYGQGDVSAHDYDASLTALRGLEAMV